MKKIIYKHTDREVLVNDALSRQYYQTGSQSEVEALHNYSISGDIESFIANGGELVDQDTIFYVGGNASIESLKYRLSVFWNDVIDRPERYKDGVRFSWDGSLDDWFMSWPHNIWSRNAYFFSNELFSEVFFWIYGETFEAQRVFPMSFGNEKWQPTINISADAIVQSLLNRFCDYFFDLDEEYFIDPARVIPLLDYFMSAVPHISDGCFSVNLADRWDEDQDGKRTNLRGHQSTFRKYIASLHGVLSDWDLECGRSEISIYKPAELKMFNEKFESLPLPTGYRELVAFIKESGENYPNA
jgi:hypothetical protein